MGKAGDDFWIQKGHGREGNDKHHTSLPRRKILPDLVRVKFVQQFHLN